MTTQQDVHITTAGTAAFHNLKITPVSDCRQFPKEAHQVSLVSLVGQDLHDYNIWYLSLYKPL